MKRPDRHVKIALAFLQDLVGDYWPRNFSVRLWDGTTWEADRGMSARFTLVINSPFTLRSMFRQPLELSLAEAYVYKDLDIEGDISAVFDLADHLIDKKRSRKESLRLYMRLLRLPSADRKRRTSKGARLEGECHSPERDRQAISYHYDVSNDFYKLWLDGNMIYSCAYFRKGDEDLDAAQNRKMDYLCRKLRLKTGERLLDIGCGWGGLLIHAAREYGAKTLGITLSAAQAGFVKDRIRKEGLERQCFVEVCDYRDINDREGFDKLVSVGMFEHVGQALLPTYFRKAWSLLKPGGVFLNHGIASNPLRPKRRGPGFTDLYVFPDGELLPVSTTLRVAETNGFEVRDVESLREHYALTLRRWLQRLEENLAVAQRLTDEMTCRIWRLYLAASAHGFASGNLNVYQTLLVKPDNGSSRLPLTRLDWYQDKSR